MSIRKNKICCYVIHITDVPLFIIYQSNWISDRLTDGPNQKSYQTMDEETWELIINSFYRVSSEITTPLQLHTDLEVAKVSKKSPLRQNGF